MTLSTGERQRTLIARAFAARPALVLLDEPCAGLDPRAREEFLAALRSAVDRSAATVVYVTHGIEELDGSYDGVMLMKAGVGVGAGPPSTQLTDANLSRLFGVPCAVVADGGRYWLHVGQAGRSAQ